MEWLRLTVRLTHFSLFLAATSLLATSLLATETVTRRPIDRTPWARRCFRGACWCLGLHVHLHGAPPSRNVLVVSNHISWTDIPILGSLTPTLFLSKAEVGHWPVIGWLAQQAGTLFIKRGSGKARRIRKAVAGKLMAGDSVLIFPEATTGRGLTVLPFHGLLLGAAADSSVPIQPVTISYRRNGRPDHLAPFVGEDTFQSHIVALLRQPPARVDVLFHSPIEVSPETGTSDLAEQLQNTVRAGLSRIQQGELDAPPGEGIRTAGDPGLPRPQ
ncbi:lysophospholipid acyltransferase family protein [Marinobacter arenosus]|uniref:lysophospholipid acyltransferase family protein n=1 Tax=Marinobacter arenosus TaxID=2856822 RepID=UPI001C4CA8F6|nr:lysophospholipid acyltransferase family protein [Marinobacter arenosus]MBW0148845.1 1-acyl-sn-glycerol-3-phosphate acyltransferase [Marinobacter arenosus]